MRFHPLRVLAGGFLAACCAIAVPSAHADQPVEATDCPSVLPTTEAVAGLTGTGYTVEHGNLPEPFTAQVLGRIVNGVGPGMDMIMADLSSAALTRAGGVWAGMSGSPVYAPDGRLIGAVAYGLAANSSIAGLTPAEDLMSIVGPADPSTPLPAAVPIPAAARQALERAGAKPGRSFERLALPVLITGAAEPSAESYIAALNARMGGTRLVTVADPVQSKAAPDWTPDAMTPSPIFAGGNLAAGLAYGDLNAVAVGTTTLVCGERVVAFGHPLNAVGASSYSMHSADAVFVQPDAFSGPFKVANTGPVVGTVDQDLFPGISGVLGVLPATVAVTTSLSTRGRAPVLGRTDVVDRSVLADAAALHTLLNVERVLRYAGAGSSSIMLTVSGTRADGSPFVVTWSGKASSETIDRATADEVYMTVQAFESQTSEDVVITAIDVTGTVEPVQRSVSIASLQAEQGGVYVDLADQVSVQAGTTLAVRAQLVPTGGTGPTTPLDLSLQIPTDFTGGFLQFSAGMAFSPGQAVFAGDFDAFLAALANGPGPDQLVVRLVPNVPESLPPDAPLPPTIEAHATADASIEPFTAFATVSALPSA